MYERKDKWSVGAWMTPNPKTIGPELSVRDAFFQMREAGYRHLIVVDKNSRLLGVVTDRDLRRPDLTDDPGGWSDYYNLDEDYEVRHIMTLKPVTVTTHDRLERAVALFAQHKFGALPVVDKHQLILGILTTHDLLRAFHETLPVARALEAS